MSNNSDILNELKTLSPILFSLKEKEKNVFVPENYFEQFADEILIEINLSTSVLSSIKKENHTVPNEYFNTFSDTILAKIKVEENTIDQGKIDVLPKKENKIFQLFINVAFAASIIGVVLFIKQTDEPTIIAPNYEKGIASLTQNEIYNYMIANSQEFNLQQIKETVKPVLEQSEMKMDIDNNEASEYIENHKNILDVDDATTDIF